MRQDLFPNMGKNWKAWVHSILRKHTLFPLQGGEHWMCNIPPFPQKCDTKPIRWGTPRENWNSHLNWLPQHTETQYSLNSSRISDPFKDPSKGLPNQYLQGTGRGTEAVMGSEPPGFCGIMLISGPHWECARSQSAALNLPKMEQITTALLFNNGDAAWRLQIPASNAPKGARRSWAGGTGAPSWKTRPASIWSLWLGLLILFFLVFYYYSISD